MCIVIDWEMVAENTQTSVIYKTPFVLHLPDCCGTIYPIRSYLPYAICNLSVSPHGAKGITNHLICIALHLRPKIDRKIRICSNATTSAK